MSYTKISKLNKNLIIKKNKLRKKSNRKMIKMLISINRKEMTKNKNNY